jgi:hypothetical protein
MEILDGGSYALSESPKREKEILPVEYAAVM